MDQQDLIKEIVIELLNKIGVSAEVGIRAQEDVLVLDLHSEDSAILIGQKGTHLAALQYLARVIAQKKLNLPTKFVLDVGGYKKNREDFLRELARQAAERVRETGEQLLLKPMSAYERRVVHEVVSSYEGMMSESVGEEPERKVIIKPV